MKYIIPLLFCISCGNGHTQNIDITPNPNGGAPQNTINPNRCVDGQKVSCQVSYVIDSSGQTVIVYGTRVCLNNQYSECAK
jgi:hypothetical protein